MLEIEKKETRFINCFKLEKFIQEHYKQPKYSIIVDVEGNNDSYIRMNVEKEEIDPEDTCYLKDWENWIENGEYGWTLELILNDLCCKGLIEEGELFIEVWW